jgi:NAD(P)-dependent dehydrogenase (short-subunit alcohol dehydrogenase family)
MKDECVVVIGGSDGIGFRVAEMAAARGAKIIIGSRNKSAVDMAVSKLGPFAKGYVVDTSSVEALKLFFSRIDQIDHLFTPAATFSSGKMTEIADDVAESAIRSKFWGQYYTVKYASHLLSKSGSVTLMSGAASARPQLNTGATYAAANCAIEGLGRALAVELAPIRVNAVSPGTLDSPRWRRRPTERRERAFTSWQEATLLHRVGTVTEVAEAVLFLMGNKYMTGSTLFVDGGYAFR